MSSLRDQILQELKSDILTELREDFLEDCRSEFADAIRDAVVEEYLEKERQHFHYESFAEIYDEAFYDKCDTIKAHAEADAVMRWSSLARFVQTEIEQLKASARGQLAKHLQTLRQEIVNSIRTDLIPEILQHVKSELLDEIKEEIRAALLRKDEKYQSPWNCFLTWQNYCLTRFAHFLNVTRRFKPFYAF
ncbi:MAG TPA: hypothetical protein PLU30_25100 [Verrucomicrobiae bacterium]|nr:hypothetical protein [Verrucomicrobiae bacterium]